jgi:hypothetical protein
LRGIVGFRDGKSMLPLSSTRSIEKFLIDDKRKKKNPTYILQIQKLTGLRVGRQLYD